MKKHIILLSLWLLTSLAMQVSAQLINMNPDPNGEPWWAGGIPEITPEIQAELDAIPILSLSTKSLSTPLPSVVDNSQKIWFRPIFSQEGGSCGQASGIGYLFTYEVNRVRNLPANDNDLHAGNQYPTHYTWNYLNKGENSGSWYQWGWNIINSSGIPTVDEYGGLWKPISLAEGRRTVWETGYDRYNSFLDNRVVVEYYGINVSTPDGLETLKHWINDHGVGDDTGGVANFVAKMPHPTNGYGVLPQESDEAGKKVILEFGFSQELHAMTIVGYNDSITFDFNGDGQFTNPEGNMAEWEIGALKVANSWGDGYQDSGFVYMPYRLLANGPGSIYWPSVHVLKVKEEYTSKVTLRVKITHPVRNKLNIKTGVAESPGAIVPDHSQTNWAYNYRRGGELPMQGNNDDPIEIELDVTSLLDGIIPGKFFIELIETSTGNPYDGELVEFVLVDYDTHNGVPIEINYSEASLPQPINSGTNRYSILYDYLPSTIKEEIHVNRDILLQKNIRVADGGILQVNSATVSVLDNIQTSINSGGKMIVDGGTLTAAQDTWPGIRVNGNSLLPQTFQNQGALILNNEAVI
ncbi:MAG: hypothetical protein EA393_14185 [Bacteroidetes bacterium]|nr:MAG: hypothetical protein EA393_14185 [Bacteroidota bacterium]